MRRISLVSLVCLISAPALAEDAQPNMAMCQFLKKQDQVVSADYQPGVDVHGNAVVPADVNAFAQPNIDVIRIPVTVDLAQMLTGAPPAIEMDSRVKSVEVYKDGRVVFEGEDVSDNAYALCGQEPVQATEAAVAPPQEIEPAAAPVQEVQPQSQAAREVTKDGEEIIWGEGY